MSDDRITDLESKISYLEYTISQLDTIVCEQSEQIARLQQTCRELSESVKRDATPKSTNPLDEKPPHY